MWFKDLYEKVGDFFSPLARAVVTGDWKHLACVAIAITANILLPGAGTFSSNLFINVGFHTLRGAAIGAVTGGISSEVMGGSFKEGAILGAKWGAVQGVVSSEQWQNLWEGKKILSNKDMLKSASDHPDIAEALTRAGFTQTEPGIFSAEFEKSGQMDIFGQIFKVPSGTRVTVTSFENEIYHIVTTQRITTTIYGPKIGPIQTKLTVSASQLEVSYNPAIRQISLINSDILPKAAREQAKAIQIILPKN